MTGLVDPWAGANQTTQTLANLGKQIDEEKRNALAEQLTRQQISQNRMTLADLERKRKVEKGALDAVANAQPTTATTFAPAEQPTEIAGRFAPNPEFTEITGRVTKPPNHDRVLLDYYKANDPEKALGMEKLLMDKFKSLSEIAPESAIEWYNDFAGTDLKFTGKKGDYSIVSDSKTGKVIAVNTRDPKDVKIVQEGERAPLVVAPGSTVLGADSKPVFTAPDKTKETWSEPYETMVGGKKALVQKSSTGQVKPVVQDSSTTVKVNVDRKPQKPLPPAALKLANEERDAIGTASNIQKDLGEFKQQIDDGRLDLGLFKNWISRGRNFAGMSNEQSSNFNSFSANLEKLRNDSLRLNKGVQTEGDAVRAWNELVDNLNDERVVKQRLEEIIQLNERAATLRQYNLDKINENYNRPPEDTTTLRNQPAAVGKKTTTMPKGARQITGPNGQKGYYLNGVAYTMDGKRIK